MSDAEQGAGLRTAKHPFSGWEQGALLLCEVPVPFLEGQRHGQSRWSGLVPTEGRDIPLRDSAGLSPASSERPHGRLCPSYSVVKVNRLNGFGEYRHDGGAVSRRETFAGRLFAVA